MITSLKIKMFLLLACVVPTVVSAQYQANGNATSLSCNCYQLTANVGNQSGSVWNTNSISLTQPFDFTFDIYLGCSDAGADGMVFGLQPIGTGVGTSGGGMGFAGVAPSVGVYIDTYQNGSDFDPPADHISINANGVILHNGGVNDYDGPASLPFNIENCAWHTLRVTWNPTTQTLQGYVNGILYVSYTGNMVANVFSGNPNVYWGMTGATGGATNLQQFCTQLSTDWGTVLDDYTCVGQPMQFLDSTSSFGQVVGWSWDFGDGGTSNLQNPTHVYTADGTYNVTLTVTDASGCQDNISQPVTVASPVLNPTASPSAICPGANAQLNAGLTHPFASQYNYSWTQASSLSNATIANPIATPAATTIYVVTVLDPTTGCTATDSVSVTITAPPDLDPIANVFACSSYVFPPIQGTGVTPNAAYYTGTGGTGLQYNVGSSFTSIGTTTLYAYTDNGCIDEESFQITVQPIPFVSIGPDITVCDGGQAVFYATSPGATNNWMNTSTASSFTATAPGEYWLEITLNGCSNSDTAELIMLAPVAFTLGADTLICQTPIQLSPSGVYASYVWQDASTNSTFTAVEPGTYFVTVTDASGCQGSQDIQIGNGCQPVVVVPNVFTPNADDVNDLFFVNAENIDNFNLVIVNRWGQVMRELSAVTDNWDGKTPNGNPASSGVYFWKLVYSYTQGTEVITEELHGNVTLQRD